MNLLGNPDPAFDNKKMSKEEKTNRKLDFDEDQDIFDFPEHQIVPYTPFQPPGAHPTKPHGDGAQHKWRYQFRDTYLEEQEIALIH